jgi:type I site-specific restriction-modification system R (restriction) subunit
LFIHNAVLVISDGLEARVGAIRADKERFMPWRTIEGETLAPAFMTQLEVLLRGMFDKRRFRHPSRRPTPTPARYLANISRFTTSSAP